MRRYVPLLALVAAVPASALAQDGVQQPAGTDDRLQHAVTAKLLLTPLPAALKELSKQSGVTLDASMSMSALKTTILVKDEPVGRVMTHLADVFHAEWKQTGDQYRLSIPSDWISRESAFVRAEDQERRKEAETTIKDLINATSQPYPQVLAELRGGKADKARTELLQKVENPGMYLVGYMFRQMNNGQWNAFWAGRPMHTSGFLPGDVAESRQSGTPPPPNRGQRQGRQQQQQEEGQTVRVSASYDPLTGKLQMSPIGLQSSGATLPGLISHPYPEGSLASLPYGKDVLAWVRTQDPAPIFQKNISGQMPAATYFGGKRSMSEALAWLHESTGVPIVADEFRVPVRIQGQSGTVASWAGAFAQANGAFLRLDGGYLMMRHGGFWRLRTIETPEDAFAKLEGKSNPLLDDYAAFAADLKPEQARPFRFLNGVLTKFDPAPLQVGMPGLRFYASLGAGERRAALSGQPIPFSSLGGTSRERFIDALDDPTGRMVGRGLPDPDNPRVAAALGFLFGAASADRVIADNNGTSQQGYGNAKRMLFGTGPRNGVQYVIPVD